MGLLTYQAATADVLVWAHYFLNCAADVQGWAYGHTADGFALAHYLYRMRCRSTRIGPLAYAAVAANVIVRPYYYFRMRFRCTRKSYASLNPAALILLLLAAEIPNPNST
jgi:hypothetical protein